MASLSLRVELMDTICGGKRLRSDEQVDAWPVSLRLWKVEMRGDKDAHVHVTCRVSMLREVLRSSCFSVL